MEENMDQNKPMIWKELILGFVVIESCIYHSIRTLPIVSATASGEALFTENLSRLTKLEPDETVKGVLSVPFPTYEVTGAMPAEDKGFTEVLLLGYEYPGTKAPDWLEVLKRESSNPKEVCE
ncbi:MAG: hypothetical protein ACPK85_14255 [Methanosarcina sp.]